jgi:hypothetical protein
MPGTFTKQFLSAASNGTPIKVTGTATASATLLHTTHTTYKDVVWLYAVNTGVGNVTLTIELGGTTSPDHLVKMVIQANSGPVLVVPGIPLSGGVQIKAFASTANLVNVVGHVDRIGQAAGASIVQPMPFDNKAVRFHNVTNEELDGATHASAFAFSETDPFSVAFWLQMDSDDLDDDDGSIIYARNDTSGSLWEVWMDQDLKIVLRLTDTYAHDTEILTNWFEDELQDERFYMVVFTHDGAGNVYGYVNGSLLVKATHSFSSATFGGDRFRIGNRAYGSDLPFEGVLGPIAIYDVQLTDAEVRTIYNEGTTIDLRVGPQSSHIQGYWRMGENDSGTTIADWSGNNRDLTMNNLSVADDVEDAMMVSEGYIATPQTPGLKCVEFVSGNGNLSNTTLLTTLDKTKWFGKKRPHTIAFWMRALGAIPANQDFFIYGDDSDDNGLLIEKYSTVGFYVRFKTSATLEHTSTARNYQMESNVFGWQLHVFTYDGAGSQDGTRTYWVNGIRGYTSAPTADTNYEWSSPEEVILSGGSNVRMCNVSMWHRQLSRSEIRKLYNNGIPTDVVADFPEDLIHHWPLGDHPDDTYDSYVDVASGITLTGPSFTSANLVTDHPANPT